MKPLKEALKNIEKIVNDKPTRYFVARKILFLDRYLPTVATNSKKLLDLGSNKGYLTEFFKNKGYDAYGLEFNKELVEFSKKNGKAKYMQGSVENIPFKDNSFDVILCLASLEHFVDRSRAMKEINRVSKKDGKVIFTVPNTWSYFFIRSFITFILRGEKAWKNVHYQQNYFHWQHQIHQFLRILDARPILAMPFIEPKLVWNSFLSNFEYNKKSLAWMSAEPIFICTKRIKEIKGDTDNTNLEK